MAGFSFFGILVSFSGNQPDSHGNELLPRPPADDDPPRGSPRRGQKPVQAFACDTLRQHRVSYVLHMYVYECASANIYTDASFFFALS